MMHQCSNRSTYGSCSCNYLHGSGCSLLLFGMTNNQSDDMENYSSTSVDCTLSLGTPSTRKFHRDHHHHQCPQQQQQRPSASISNLCDILQQNKQQQQQQQQPFSSSSSSCYVAHFNNKNLRQGPHPSSSFSGDPLLARRCANCDTTSTPLWRNGPRGPKSLCNACGIRYKKEERRATTSIDLQHRDANQNRFYRTVKGQRPSSISNSFHEDFRLFHEEDDDRDSDSIVSCLPWRLDVSTNDFHVRDRATGLVHDFT